MHCAHRIAGNRPIRSWCPIFTSGMPMFRSVLVIVRFTVVFVSTRIMVSAISRRTLETRLCQIQREWSVRCVREQRELKSDLSTRRGGTWYCSQKQFTDKSPKFHFKLGNKSNLHIFCFLMPKRNRDFCTFTDPQTVNVPNL